MNDPPPDRSRVLTERRNPRSMRLHELDVAACVRLFEREDRRIVRAVRRARPGIVALIEAAEPGFVAGGRLIWIGAGTSGRLGVLDAAEAPPTFDVPPGRVLAILAGGHQALVRSAESAEDDRRGAWPELASLALTARDTLVGIAAGGTTPFVLGALDWARQIRPNPTTGLITCDRHASAAVDHRIVLDTGPEILTGSTRLKAATATKMVLNVISTTLMIRAGRVYQNLMVDLRATNQKLLDRGARIVMTLTGLDRPAALDLLAQAGGAVKTAVVMARLGLRRDQAEKWLARCHGRLDAALKPPRTGDPPS